MELLDNTNPISVNAATTLCVKASLELAKGSFSFAISEQIQLWAIWITGDPTSLASPTVQLLMGIVEHCLVPFGLVVVAFSGSLAAIFDPIAAKMINLTVASFAIYGLFTLLRNPFSLLLNSVINFRSAIMAFA